MYTIKGDAGISGKWSTITAAKGFDANVIQIPQQCTHFIPFTSGGTAAIGVGEIVTGATSTATAYVIGVTLDEGTWAGGTGTGILWLNRVSGTFQAENLDIGVDADVCTIAANVYPCDFSGLQAKSALITCEGFIINYNFSKIAPTATAGTNYGHVLAVGGAVVISGIQAIRNFSCINSVNASGSIVKYTVFY